MDLEHERWRTYMNELQIRRRSIILDPTVKKEKQDNLLLSTEDYTQLLYQDK